MEVTLGSSCFPEEAGSRWPGTLLVPSVVSEKSLEGSVGPALVADLSWWMDLGHLIKGAPYVTAPLEQSLFSDASLHGWGAHLVDSLVSRVWSPQERRFYTNHLEMMAAFQALQSFQQEVLGTVVSLTSYNSTVVAYLRNSRGTWSDSPGSGGDILQRCEDNSVSLLPRFVPGRRNAVADVLGRECVESEWTLHPIVCRQVFQVYLPICVLQGPS
ncbi:hypothetical protein E2C01_067960 [Portunus trituberculatus]|uniref:RNase H type-1 domain-containing protein n=1 Tax=Portunus trituberculatus TaxID=210409 RepID=A0A5B7HYU4_PORTR|nr:hypothetical protein [Portunus trituberculatus]